MTAYQFRLASVLKLRESVRDERRLALAETVAEDAALEQRIDAIHRDLAAMWSRRSSTTRPGTIDLDRLLDADRYEAELRAEERRILDQRQRLAGEIDKRRDAVVEADADVRALEKLREAGLARHRDEELRDEIKHLDEVASRQNRTSRLA